MKKKEPKALTRMEQRYYDLLASSPDGVHRDTLNALHINGIGSNAVDVHIGNLRRKIASTHEIVAMRGFGYKMKAI